MHCPHGPAPLPPSCTQDPHVPAEGRKVVWNTLTNAGVDFTWHEFNGQHAFMRDEGPRYDPELSLQVSAGTTPCSHTPAPPSSLRVAILLS